MIGILLAGGKSSRMGTDKAKLLYENQTLISIQIEKLNAVVGVKNVIISGNYSEFPHVNDIKPDLGPLGGIYSVLEYFPEAGYYLFMPIDMPMLTKESLEHLAFVSKTDMKSNCWSFAKHPMPLIIKNHIELPDILTEILNGPKRQCSVWRLAELLHHNLIDSSMINEKEFQNFNTSEDWEKLNHEYSPKP